MRTPTNGPSDAAASPGLQSIGNMGLARQSIPTHNSAMTATRNSVGVLVNPNSSEADTSFDQDQSSAHYSFTQPSSGYNVPAPITTATYPIPLSGYNMSAPSNAPVYYPAPPSLLMAMLTASARTPATSESRKRKTSGNCAPEASSERD
jgi:hypothetical protein